MEVHQLADKKNAGEPDVSNSFSEPNRITTKKIEVTAKDGKLDFTFPALSLTARPGRRAD